MLALALGGRSVAEWKAAIPRPEFLAWIEMYRLYPFDDFHRFHRPAAMMAAAWGGDLEKRLEWLQPTPQVEPDPIPEVSKSKFTAADLSVFNVFARNRK